MRACDRPLKLTEQLPHTWKIDDIAVEQLGQCAFSPVHLDVIHLCSDLGPTLCGSSVGVQ